MLRSGARWRDCPPDYGPYTTIYNRFNRWSRQGVWSNIFYALTGSTGRIGTMSIDATHIKAHRSAAGAKGGLPAGDRPLARRVCTTKIHALTEDHGRPIAFMITPGNCQYLAGCCARQECLRALHLRPRQALAQPTHLIGWTARRQVYATRAPPVVSVVRVSAGNLRDSRDCTSGVMQIQLWCHVRKVSCRRIGLPLVKKVVGRS